MRTEVVVIVTLYFAALLGWGPYTFVREYRSDTGDMEARYVGTCSYGAAALVATLVAAWASSYTLLAAAASGFRFGLSGPLWYALGVGLPILLFVWPVNIVRRAFVIAIRTVSEALPAAAVEESLTLVDRA